MMTPLQKTDAEWQQELPEDVYRITRQKGTEAPFTGVFEKHWEDGIYMCVCCQHPLFDSETKYPSGSGWPSFWHTAGTQAVCKTTDTTHGMVRTEISCAHCNAHLGHVFEDGPQPTGLRYCVNSASLNFQAREQ